MGVYMLKAIIIDDEPYCCEILAAMLESDCPDAEVTSICSNASDGLTAIRQHSPDLVFLDVEMPKMNGFEMLEQLPAINFHLIFTTSYDQYALKEIEEILEQHSFIRVHRSYLVNLNEIEKYIKGEGGYLVMSDGTSIDVARNKKEILLKKLLPYKE